jgi:hypothetical protein
MEGGAELGGFLVPRLHLDARHGDVAVVDAVEDLEVGPAGAALLV